MRGLCQLSTGALPQRGKGLHALYNYQHFYWWLVGPPLILPVYFHIDNLKFLLHTKSLTDLLWTLTFFIRWCASPNRPGRADTSVCSAGHSSAG
jgi:hypothetical protein